MKKKELSKNFSKLGKKGGKARLTKLTREQRREIASKGGRASAEKTKKEKVRNGSQSANGA